MTRVKGRRLQEITRKRVKGMQSMEVKVDGSPHA
jgi:hypothetical protein